MSKVPTVDQAPLAPVETLIDLHPDAGKGKEAVRARDSAEAGLKTTERQFEEVRKELHYSEINLATEK